MSDRNNYKNMSTEELRILIRHDDSEKAFAEYHSRLDWKKPPNFSSSEEEARWFRNLLKSRKN